MPVILVALYHFCPCFLWVSSFRSELQGVQRRILLVCRDTWKELGWFCNTLCGFCSSPEVSRMDPTMQLSRRQPPGLPQPPKSASLRRLLRRGGPRDSDAARPQSVPGKGDQRRGIGGFGGEMSALLRSRLPWRLAHLTP